jgi:hypothetical protein
MPSAEMAKNLLHNPRVINYRDDAPACAAPFAPPGAAGRHGILADGAAEGIDMPDAED